MQCENVFWCLGAVSHLTVYTKQYPKIRLSALFYTIRQTLPQTAGTMGVIEFLFCVIRLATTRHFSNNSSIGGGGGNGGVSGESGSGSSKIRMAGR